VFYVLDPTIFMAGTITSFSTTTLVLSVSYIGGSGTYANWAITATGAVYTNPIAIGTGSGSVSTASNAISIGLNAGTEQNTDSIAIGNGAGVTGPFGPIGAQSISIGKLSRAQGTSSISIGENATSNGTNSIAIGKDASSNGNNNSIVLNASSSALNANGTSRFFVRPIRSETVSGTMRALYYNTSTFEITYQP
jgi:hypothetical protein